MTNFTHYAPTDILDFIKYSLKKGTNLVSVSMAPENVPLETPAGGGKLFIKTAIIIEFKDINKSDWTRSVHDSLKNYLKDNTPSLYGKLVKPRNTKSQRPKLWLFWRYCENKQKRLVMVPLG